IARMCSAGASTNTPTRRTNGGSDAAIARALIGSIARGLLGKNTKPTASAPAATAALASSTDVMPQILTATRPEPRPVAGRGAQHELLQGRAGIVGQHQVLADEEGVEAGVAQPAHLARAPQAALRDRDDVVRDLVDEVQRGLEVHGQRA